VTAPESTDKIIGSDPVKQLYGLIKIGGKIRLVSESPIGSNGLGCCFVVVNSQQELSTHFWLMTKKP
jgi:hypothetical protein